MSETTLSELQRSIEANQLKTAYARLQEQLCAVNQELERFKQAKEEEDDPRLPFILKGLTDGILFLNLDGVIIYLNESAAKILNVSQQQTGTTYFEKLFPDDLLGFSMKEALQFGISHKLLYKTLNSKELELSSSFIFEGPKQKHGLLVILRDITEKQRMTRALNQNEKMRELGEMAAHVSHEIRNPLGGIRGYASLLMRDLSASPYLQEMAKEIVEGTKRLEILLTSILQYAKPVRVEPRSIELSRFLKELVRFVKVDPAFPLNVKWISHIPDEPLMAPIDPDAMKAALLNLIFNALQAMPEGGTATLSLLKTDSCYQISLSDTGVGMSEEQLERLFSPFFSTKEKGTGLGLIEMRKIIQAHGGRIDVRSSLGKGTTFSLTLPLKR